MLGKQPVRRGRVILHGRPLKARRENADVGGSSLITAAGEDAFRPLARRRRAPVAHHKGPNVLIMSPRRDVARHAKEIRHAQDRRHLRAGIDEDADVEHGGFSPMFVVTDTHIESRQAIARASTCQRRVS
ncbi:hypothetical protein D3C80_1534740 [compost metagenome]